MTPVRVFPSPLPIDDVLAVLDDALARGPAVVLQAPPGAGKTTRVPLSLLGASWLGDQRVVMLEPRRLAARSAARYMASTLGESVGQTVGFRVRGETRVGPRTRIEVVTEGVLTRMLQTDPTLEGIGAVIFDEFHERSLQADLGLALALQTQSLLRPSLRLLVMSATLDGAAVSALLGDAPVVTSVGRSFPVVVRHIARREGQRIEGAVASAVEAALRMADGSVLAFLPGVGEIRRTHMLLERSGLPSDVRIFPLFGDLSPAAQDAAIAPAAVGQRKVVLATSVAETSLTIEGIRIVVDGGVARVPRFSPRTGMTRLETVRVSRAAATQRAGRAGRTAPGIAYRLWREDEDAHLVDRATPEILEADLTQLALDLALVGVHDPRALRWIDHPPAAALEHARALLRQLGMLDDGGAITPHGREGASLGMHPRLGHMLLRGRALDAGATACVLAALLDERDVMRRDAPMRDVDLSTRVLLVAGDRTLEHPSADHELLRRVRERVRVLRKALEISADAVVDSDATGWLTALAYPDRVGMRRAEGTGYVLRSGVGAVLEDAGSLGSPAFLVVADLDGRLPNARIYLAAVLAREELTRIFDAQIVREEEVAWDARAGGVRTVEIERLGAIVLRESPLRVVDDDRVARVLLDAIERDDGIKLEWPDGARRLCERVGFVRRLDDRWPDLGRDALQATMADWLLPHLGGLRRRRDVQGLDLTAILLDVLDWEQRRDLDLLAPTHVVVPTGSRIAVEYGDPDAPSIAVRLQELFGLVVTPSVGGGRVPLVLQLLSPARRPVQVTRDLAGFWRSSYFDVRRDLRGRYPKHEWPDDPAHARPTRRTKPRSS